jgi:hypothetical protein
VAGEEEVVLGRDGKGIAHEGCRVDDQGTGHLAGDAVWCVSCLFLVYFDLRGIVYATPGGIRGMFARTFQDPSGCPLQRLWGYRSWRRVPRNLEQMGYVSHCHCHSIGNYCNEAVEGMENKW